MAAATPLAWPVRTPAWQLTYASVNITADITGMVLGIDYDSREERLADELTVQLEDRDQRWQGPWYPVYGDTVTLQIGYAGEPLLPCGSFQVDAIELEGPPDVVHLKCLAAGITPSLRTRSSVGYENVSLASVADQIATKHNFTVVNAPPPTALIRARITQRHETDLAFLHRLAKQYNYDFSVRGTQLIFYPRTPLETAPTVLSIQRTDVTKFEFKGKTGHIFAAATVSYQNFRTKSLISQTTTAPAALTGDTLALPRRAESASDAQAQAVAELHRRTMHQLTCRIELPGTTRVVAGNNVAIAGFGGNDGVYLITRARHALDRANGYHTEFEGRLL